jgi:hypothetical protein
MREDETRWTVSLTSFEDLAFDATFLRASRAGWNVAIVEEDALMSTRKANSGVCIIRSVAPASKPGGLQGFVCLFPSLQKFLVHVGSFQVILIHFKCFV